MATARNGTAWLCTIWVCPELAYLMLVPPNKDQHCDGRTTMYNAPTYRLLSIPSYNTLVGHLGIGSIPKNLVVPILRCVWSNTKRLKRPVSYPWAYIQNNAHYSTIKPYHHSYVQPWVTITRITHPQNASMVTRLVTTGMCADMPFTGPRYQHFRQSTWSPLSSMNPSMTCP